MQVQNDVKQPIRRDVTMIIHNMHTLCLNHTHLSGCKAFCEGTSRTNTCKVSPTVEVAILS